VPLLQLGKVVSASARNPLDITVVVPAFNRAKIIVRSLDSVRAQRRPPTELIVVDDASTDGTSAVVRKWSERNRFPATVVRLEQNAGPAVARNRGIGLATTRYVGFLDSDDEYMPDALSTLVQDAERGGAVLSFADATLVTAEGEEPHALFRPRVRLAEEASPVDPDRQLYRLSEPTATLLKASIIPTSATCFRRDAALRAGGMPESFRAGEDWLFWLRLASAGSFVFRLCDLARHHRHAGNLTHPDHAERTTREKLRGYLALEHGELGVRLSPDQHYVLRRHIARQARSWRYSLSRLGLRDYTRGIRSDLGRSVGSPMRHVIDDPRAVLRAAYWSVDQSRGPSREPLH